MKGKWVREHDEYLYLIDGEYAAISMLPPDPDVAMEDEYQLSIGYPSNLKEQFFLTGSLGGVKKEAGAIADEYLGQNETPTLTN